MRKRRYRVNEDRDRVTFEEKGYRDVRWCPNLNEPFIIEYDLKTGKLDCPNCGSYEESNHQFICHILKPHYHGED